jgi:hypothetical protein
MHPLIFRLDLGDPDGLRRRIHTVAIQGKDGGLDRMSKSDGTGGATIRFAASFIPATTIPAALRSSRTKLASTGEARTAFLAYTIPSRPPRIWR